MKNGNARDVLPKTHALIAEDDALIAIDMEQTLLANFNLRVSVAYRLRDGLAMLESDPPHIAILDYDLDGAGIEPLAQALANAGVPIVFVSGYRTHPLDGLADGLKLEKPYEINDFVAMVGKALERRAS